MSVAVLEPAAAFGPRVLSITIEICCDGRYAIIQKIEEQTKEANNVLQSKNVSIEAINQHLQLNEKLKEHGLSTHDIDKLLNVLGNAKRYGFGGKEIAEKLWKIQELEWKEKELKDKKKVPAWKQDDLW